MCARVNYSLETMLFQTAQSQKICDLLMKKDCESCREVLLLAISVGKLRLVTEVLSRFDDFKWKEDAGLPFVR